MRKKWKEKKKTKEGGLSPQEGDVRKKKRERQRKARRWLPQRQGSACPQPRISFLVHEYLGSERPISIEVSAPALFLYEEAMCEGSSGNGLLYAAKAVYAPIKREQYHKRTTLRRLKIPLQSIVARNAALSPWSKAWARKLSSDKRQSTFIHKLDILWWFHTWAVLRGLANARKCQLEDFCEEKRVEKPTRSVPETWGRMYDVLALRN